MHDDIKWLFGILIIFALIWLAGGGLFRPETSKGPFLKPLAPVGTGEVYGRDFIPTKSSGPRRPPAQTTQSGSAAPSGSQTSSQNYRGESAPSSGSSGGGTVYSRSGGTYGGSGSGSLSQQLAATEDKGAYSPLLGALSIGAVSVSDSDPAKEYVQITASPQNTRPIPLTGLTLKSDATGRSVSIGKGVYFPQMGVVNTEEAVFLTPGGSAYIVTGQSPTGYSFRLNRCTGFFEQFQDFTPSLPLECPYPRDETLPQAPNNLDDACLDYIDNINQCVIVPNPPTTLRIECRDYIRTNISYPKCVSLHKNEGNFYRNVWRLYLSRDEKLWKSRRELLRLLDTNGKIIDSYTY